MSPSALLDLWRDRWAKPAISALLIPYRDGTLSRRLEAFAFAPVWRNRPWRWGVRMAACLALLWATALPLTANAQIVFAIAVTAVVVYVRRFAGGILPLALACLSIVLSLRYFHWRVSSTLPSGAGGLDFAWAFALWSAELLMWLCSALMVARRLLPLHRTTTQQEGLAMSRPAVDAILWIEHATLAELQAQWKAVRALQWPDQRINLRAMCANEPTPEIAAWLLSQGLSATRWAPSEQQPPWERVDLSAIDAGTMLVWILDVRSPPVPPLFLTGCVACFADNPLLGLLHTPANPWTAGSTAQATPSSAGASHGCARHALVRRSALEDIVRPPHRRDPLHNSMATCMEMAGWEQAQLDAIGPPSPRCIYAAGTSTGVLRFRRLLDALWVRLRFFRPLAHTLWVLTPIVAFWLGTLPIQSTLLTLTAFLLPHWLMAHLAAAASDHRGRLTFSLLLRELVLPVYLQVRTTQSFLRTHWHHLGQRWRANRSMRDPALPWAQWIAVLAWVALNAWACAQASMALRNSHQPWNGSILILLALWAAWNILQAFSKLAIDKEALLVMQTHAQRQSVEAMVQWAGQRPLPCMARNFPQTKLTLEWPSALDFPEQPRLNDSVHFSLFHGFLEYPFEGRVTAIQSNRLQLQVAAADLAAYQALAGAIFSRDAQWPRWLPARDADNLLPSRVRAVLGVLEASFYNLTVQASLTRWVQRLRKWLRPGNHHHV